MTKKKTSPKNQAKKPSRSQSAGGSGVARFFASSLVRQLILVALILGLVYWQRETILGWLGGVRDGLIALFGWGLLLALLAVGILGGMLGAGRQASLIHHWNRWLGAAVVLTVIWGILALYGMGGSIGRGIIGAPGFWGVLRVAGLVVLSIILFAPRASFSFTLRSGRWLINQFHKAPAPAPSPEASAGATSAPDEVPISPERAASPGVTAALSSPKEAKLSPVARAQRELKQVADDVWKKYGETANLVTVDGWRLPPLDIIDRVPEVEFSQADNVKRAKLIEEALGSYGVDAKVSQINVGPTVTQFGVEPGWDRKIKDIREKDKDGNAVVRQEEVSRTRVKVERISSLANDLALALAAPSIRIEAPVPGKSIVGIEVPNTVLGLVSLRGVIETSNFQKLKAKTKMALAMGKGAGGRR